MRVRALKVALPLLVVVLVAVVATGPPGDSSLDEPTKNASDVRQIHPVENGSTVLWPYTSRSKSFEQATLPINVVVRKDAETVRRLLISGSETDTEMAWNESSGSRESGDGDEKATVNGTKIEWGSSHGAPRYTYVKDSESDRWYRATYQLTDGPYFGKRIHLRLYEGHSEDETWTAIQAHREHWDWFRLRHSVSTLAVARHQVEQDFRGHAMVSSIHRERYANGGALDSDGWVTVIELQDSVADGPKPEPSHSGSVQSGDLPGDGGTRTGARTETGSETTAGNQTTSAVVVPALGRFFLVVSLAAMLLAVPRQETAVEWIESGRLTLAHVALFGGTAALPLVARIGAIAVETSYPTAPVFLVGAPFYLLQVLGLPALATVFGSGLRSEDGFSAAVLGLGTGVLADYAYLQIAVIPFGALVQRLVLLFGLGLIAAGGNRWAETWWERHKYRALGAVVWVGALGWPLVG